MIDNPHNSPNVIEIYLNLNLNIFVINAMMLLLKRVYFTGNLN